MRKTPDVAGAAEQYFRLAKSLQQNGDYPHAAFCCVAAARYCTIHAHHTVPANRRRVLATSHKHVTDGVFKRPRVVLVNTRSRAFVFGHIYVSLVLAASLPLLAL